MPGSLGSGVGVALGSGVGVALGSGVGVALGSGVGVALGSGVGVALGSAGTSGTSSRSGSGPDSPGGAFGIVPLGLSSWAPGVHGTIGVFSRRNGAPDRTARGSTNAPLTSTSKCRWHPVDRPVVPARPICWPLLTFWPTVTPSTDRCA